MNKELRKPSEVILRDGRTLEEVLKLHKMWLYREEGGKKANLSFEDLSYTDLSSANLKGTDFYHANLSYANLEGTNLEGTNLSCAILEGTNLSYANLTEAILTNTKFYLTNLYKAKGDFVGVENIGSRNDNTHYFYKDNRVICGCFSGTMEEFKEKVKESYGEGDRGYQEYMIAIDTLKRLAEL